MPINLMVQFSIVASDAAGTRYSGTIKNLNANPDVSLDQIAIMAGKTLVKASVPAAASQGNLSMAISSDEGGKNTLGVETDLTTTTVFNPSTIKNVLLKGGTYSFEATSTADAAAANSTVTLLITIQ